MLKIHVLSVHVCAQLLFINIYQKLHCKRSRILNTHENILIRDVSGPVCVLNIKKSISIFLSNQLMVANI